MAKAIRVHEVGGPEVLRWEEVDLPSPGPGEARVRHHAVGLNFIDVYHRTGLYKQPLPFTPGMEGAGVVEAVGPGVTDVAPGQRVAYAGGTPGAYGEVRLIAADRLVALPDAIADETAAAMMLKGMTAQYLLRQTVRIVAGDAIVIHAAAGGTGRIVSQWARHLGATVIGTVGSEDKAAIARAHGCHHVILYDREPIAARVRELTGGKGVRVVYDGVGRKTFDQSLDCLQPRGFLVLFGQASGPVPPFDPLVLSQKGSLYLTRPVLFAYTAARADLLATARDLFDVVASGVVKIEPAARFPLAAAADAHRALEGRATTGSTILTVDGRA